MTLLFILQGLVLLFFSDQDHGSLMVKVMCGSVVLESEAPTRRCESIEVIVDREQNNAIG